MSRKPNPDNLSKRMKEQYEDRYKNLLSKRTYTIVRIKATNFKHCGINKPYNDDELSNMNKTAIQLLKNITDAKLAYTCSNEISLILTDFDEVNDKLYCDGDIQKMVSQITSMTTAIYNKIRQSQSDSEFVLFNTKVFQIHSGFEIENYLLNRQRNSVRNGTIYIGKSLFGHDNIQNLNTQELRNKLEEKYDLSVTDKFLYGTFIYIENDTIVDRMIDISKLNLSKENILTKLIPQNI